MSTPASVAQSEASKTVRAISLYMCERTVKIIINDACNKLLQAIYRQPNQPLVEKLWPGHADLKVKLRRYFLGKTPDPDSFVMFFDIQEDISNVKIFSSEPRRKLYIENSPPPTVNPEELEKNRVTQLLCNKYAFVDMFLGPVHDDYNYETAISAIMMVSGGDGGVSDIGNDTDTPDRDFVLGQINMNMQNIVPMVKFTMEYLQAELAKGRPEILELIRPFVKFGMSNSKTLQLVSDQVWNLDPSAASDQPAMVFLKAGFAFKKSN